MGKECDICCEKFNKSDHKKVICNYCEYDVCNTCTQTYLMRNTQDQHCLNCKHAWNRENMELNFTKKFYTIDYKKHRENIIFERQMSLLPETQPYVEGARRKATFAKEIVEIRKKLLEISKDRNKHRTINVWQLTPDEQIEWHKKNGEFEKKIEIYKIDVSVIQRIIPIIIGRDSAKAERRQFVRKCPADNCRGFLSTQWKCGLCDIKVCNKCNEIKKESGGSREGNDEEHVCNPENIASTELLAKECRQCPKPDCGAMIFKIEGCSQIWCTQCHTAFCWRTGKIETGTIHNPHYYEFQRKMNGGVAPRVPGDNPCGGMPEYIRFITHLQVILGIAGQYRYPSRTDTPQTVANRLIMQTYETIHRMYGHIQNVEMQRYAVTNQIEGHRDLRIKYMLNELSKEELKSMLYRREKDKDKKTEITMVLQTYQNVIMENITTLMTKQTVKDVKDCLDTMNTLRLYINECMQNISKRYGNVAPQITKNWAMSTTGIEKKKEEAALAASKKETV